MLETPHFVARREELSQMRENLLGDERRRYVVLHGLGGIGKTQLAIAYAVRHRDDYSAIFWLDASSADALRSSFVRVAKQILQKYPTASGLAGLDPVDNVDVTVKRVNVWLSNDLNNRWLIICDNHDTPELPGIHNPAAFDLRTFLPTAHQGKVIVTTRSAAVALGHQMRIKKMEELQDGLKILEQTSGRKNLATGAYRCYGYLVI